MSTGRCPFKSKCPHSEACQDHTWFCVWVFWAVPVVALAVVTYLMWQLVSA